MPRERYTLATLNLQELNRVLDSISRRLNYIKESGNNTDLSGQKLINLAAGSISSDAIRLDQAFLLENLAIVILGTAGRVTITDNGDETITIDVVESGLDHNLLSNLTVDDVHTQYLLLAGRTGGQVINGDIKGLIRAKQYFFAGF